MGARICHCWPIEATRAQTTEPARLRESDAVTRAWADRRPRRLWRRHSDAVNLALVRRWISPGSGAALKTDLFDEAVGEGLLAELRARCEAVAGVDASEVVVGRAADAQPGLDLRRADVRSLPFAESSFDVVLSNSTLDHFERRADIDLALGELARVLRPGGILVLTLDNLRNPAVALRSVLPGAPLRRLGVVPYYVGPTLGPAGARRAIERAGLVRLEQTAILHCPRVAAVALAGVVDRRASEAGRERLLRSLRAWEHLERLPTRTLTGHFLAIRARKP